MITSDEFTGSSACIRFKMSAIRTDAFPFALTFGITPKENYQDKIKWNNYKKKKTEQNHVRYPVHDNELMNFTKGQFHWTISFLFDAKYSKAKASMLRKINNIMYSKLQPQVCEWLLQYAKVSLYHHRLGFPTTERRQTRISN